MKIEMASTKPQIGTFITSNKHLRDQIKATGRRLEIKDKVICILIDLHKKETAQSRHWVFWQTITDKQIILKFLFTLVKLTNQWLFYNFLVKNNYLDVYDLTSVHLLNKLLTFFVTADIFYRLAQFPDTSIFLISSTVLFWQPTQ